MSEDVLNVQFYYSSSAPSSLGTSVKVGRQLPEYQAGRAAGERNSRGIRFVGWSCPTDHIRSYCVGWNETSCSSEGCGGDYTVP